MLDQDQSSQFVPKSVDVLVCFCSPDLAYSYVEAKFLYDLYKPRLFFVYNNLVDFDFHFQVYYLYDYMTRMIPSDKSVLIWFAAHGSSDGRLEIRNHSLPKVPEFSNDYRRALQQQVPATLENVGRNTNRWSLVQYGMFVKAFVNFFLEGRRSRHFVGDYHVYFNTCMSPSLLNSIYEIIVDTLMMSETEKIIRLNLVCYKENTAIADKDNDLMMRLRELGMTPDPIARSEFIDLILGPGDRSRPEYRKMEKYLDRVKAVTREASMHRMFESTTAKPEAIKQWPSEDRWTTSEESGRLIRRSIVY